MTRFRYPSGWAKRPLGERPVLTDTWLDPRNKPPADAPLSRIRSFQYWTQIHWATPLWMNAEQWDKMRLVYESSTPLIHEVDHIVPLKHKLVCGLNCPDNIERVPIRTNQLKSNHYWPDCPDDLCPVKNLPVDMFGDSEPHQMRLI